MTDHRTRRRRTGRALLGLALAAGLAIGAPDVGANPTRAPIPFGASAGGPGQADTVDALGLVDRSPWVAAEDTLVFDLRLEPDALVGLDDGTADLRVRLRLDEAVTTPDDLAASRRGDVGTPFQASVRAYDTLPVNPDGSHRFSVAITEAPVATGDTADVFRLRDPGVYPAVLTLQEADGTVLDTIRTPVVRLGTDTDPLDAPALAPVLRFGVPPTRTPDGVRALTSSELDRLDRIAALLAPDETGSAPTVTIDAVPDTLVALAESDDPRAVRVLDALAGGGTTDADTDWSVLAQPYLPLSPTALDDAGLTDVFDRSVAVGRPVVAAAVAGRVLDPGGTPQADVLDPIVLDDVLGAALTGPTAETTAEATAVALAQIVLADTGSVDTASGDPDPDTPAPDTPARPVTVVAIDDVAPTSVLVAVLALLDDPASPVPLRTIDPADAATPTEPRELPATPDRVPDLTAIAPAFTATSAELASLTSVTGPGLTSIDADHRLLTAVATAVDDDDRAAYVTAVAAGIEDTLGQVRIAGETDLNLTSRQGSLPITIVNDTGNPVDVTIRLRSDRLRFPTMPDEGLPVRIDGESIRVDVPVEALATGSVPTFVELRSADGRLVLATQRLNVRSSAVSGAGLVLSLGALGVLVVWWVRTWRRNRSGSDDSEVGPAGAG